MWRVMFGLAALVGAAALCVRAEAAPKVITQPDWVQRPRAEDLERDYPLLAQFLEVEGYVAVSCKVDSFGRLAACAVVAEAPQGLGFGRGALAMASLFRMRPMTVNGAPVEGGKITIPIAFRLPQGETPPRPPVPKASDPVGLVQARRLAASTAARQDLQRYFSAVADQIEFTDDSGASAEVQSAAASAVRAAAQVRNAEMQETLAQAYAATLSAAEMTAVLDAEASDGWAVISPGDDVKAIRQMLEREYLRQVRTEGRERFCQNRDCDPASALAKPVEATIQNPRWIEGPDAAMAARARPPVVGLLGLSGVARLRCRIDASATPENCEVVAEAPAGLGFGRGALGLAPRYRLDPGLMAQGAQGETVIVTASFPASEDDSEPFAAPSPRSQKAAALARQFLADGIPLIRKALDGDWRAREAAMTEGMDPAAAADAKSAVQTAIAHAEDHYIEAITATYAALYSESQLAAAYGLTHGPSGQALKDDMDRLAAVTSQVWRYYAQLVATDVHTSFCKAHGCPAPASAAAGRSAPVSPAK